MPQVRDAQNDHQRRASRGGGTNRGEVLRLSRFGLIGGSIGGGRCGRCRSGRSKSSGRSRGNTDRSSRVNAYSVRWGPWAVFGRIYPVVVLFDGVLSSVLVAAHCALMRIVL